MEEVHRSLSVIEAELGRLPAVVGKEFHGAVATAERLSRQDLLAWAEEGVAIATCAFRSWEAACEYFRVTPQLLETLEFPHFMNWAQWGRKLCGDSFVMSSTYFRASPETLALLPSHRVEEWAKLGRSLYKGTWRSTWLSCRFLELSPELFRYLKMEEMAQFGLFIEAVSRDRKSVV